MAVLPLDLLFGQKSLVIATPAWVKKELVDAFLCSAFKVIFILQCHNTRCVEDSRERQNFLRPLIGDNDMGCFLLEALESVNGPEMMRGKAVRFLSGPR